ncbi:hypothetical protein [Pseudofulvibacter geojedonensis]|uniref:Uncharacterized protein n=1 Tax=Pseudofulvibacter geojedonensis TaxID=1123758 RepID=A0ABW3HYS3_9FLAO
MKAIINFLEFFYGINENQFKSRKGSVDFRQSRIQIWNKRRHFAH